MTSLPVDLVTYINLDVREDRRLHMEAQLAGCPHPTSRFSAVRLPASPKEMNIRMRPGLEEATGVASIYKSHLNALKAAEGQLGNGAFVLLEDDCHIDPKLWEEKVGIEKIDNWDMVLLDPRYRSKHPQEAGAPKFAWQPFGTEPILLKTVRKDYNCTGAHFCIFNGSRAVRKTIELLEGLSEIRDVDNIYAFDLKTYGISTGMVRTGGFSSDHN